MSRQRYVAKCSIARIQRVLVLCWMAALVACIWQTLVAGPHPIATLALVLLLFGHSMLLGAEFLLMAIIGDGDQGLARRRQTLIRAWFQECVTAVRVFGWQQPFRSRAWPDLLGQAESGRRGILLVHGFACNRGLWLDWLERLHDRGVPCLAIDLEPPWAPIDDHERTIEQAVTGLERVTSLPPVVVAHSMGGLAARAWWAGTKPDRIHRLLTIGSPHHGTWMARFGLSPNVRQMRPGSEWLKDLYEREGSARRSRTTCCYSHFDNIVFPPRLARLEGADNRLIADEPHLHMVWNANVWAEALHWLESGPPHAQPAT